MQHQQLMQSEKLSSLGVLVGGIVHEINNPNNYILPNAKLVSEIWQDSKKHLLKQMNETGDFDLAGLSFKEDHQDITDIIEGIIFGAKKIDDIIKNLKNYVRPTDLNLEQGFKFNEIIKSSLLIMTNLIKKSTQTFNLNLSNDLPILKGNSQQIEQVIINLISNACESMDKQYGKLDIETQFNESKLKVELIITDNGVGMSEETKKQLFNPFYTTKREDGGLGLGMSISYKIIQNHKGDLKYISDINKGTKTILSLPVENKNDKKKDK